MSATPNAIPSEIHLRHVTWRQGSRFGTWMEAAIVDGKLVAESEHRLDLSVPLMLRLTSLSGESLALTASEPELIEELGQPYLVLVPLPLQPEDIIRMAAVPAPAAPQAQAPEPAVRPGFVLSMALSITALIGAIALNFMF